MKNIEILITEEEIQKRVKELAEELYQEYKDEEVVFICTLKGAVFFACDLLKKYPSHNAILEFIKISSYIGEESSGKVTLNLEVKKENIENKHVIIIEDIVDTGRSLDYLTKHILEMKPKTLKTCALLDKKIRRVVDIDPDYVGFEIDDYFVIGYGLDDEQKRRNLPYIGVKK